MRAKAGIATTVMAMHALVRPRPSTATMARASTSVGKASMMSTIAMRKVSLLPRRNPAIRPIVPPTTRPMAIVTTPAIMATRAP